MSGPPASGPVRPGLVTVGRRLAQDEQLPAWMRSLVSRVDGETLPRYTRTMNSAIPPRPRRSAVLILFGSSAAGPDLLLTARASSLRDHAGQPAFPGGAVEHGEDAVRAALREGAEETGLVPASVVPAAQLPDLYLGPSGFLVSPVVGYWRRPGPVHVVSSDETAAVARVPVADLTEPAHRGLVRHPSGYIGPAFEVAEMVVWGFTAGLIDVLLEFGGWTRPWDHGRLITLPDHAGRR